MYMLYTFAHIHIYTCIYIYGPVLRLSTPPPPPMGWVPR